MNKRQRLCVIGVFILLLSSTAIAGDIRTPVAPPAPPPDERIVTAAATANTPQVTQDQGGASETIAEIALSLVQTMLFGF